MYIERSTGECRDGGWVKALDLEGVERIVVGTGPGSFAGIRSALAFAQGYALATKCEVLGLPSACAIAAQVIKQSNNSNNQTIHLAVVGDARQGKIWVALFDGFKLERDVFQVNQDELPGAFVKGGVVFDREVLFWAGYVYRQWHYLTGESSKEIYKQANAATMNRSYFGYHTVDVSVAIEWLKEAKQ